MGGTLFTFRFPHFGSVCTAVCTVSGNFIVSFQLVEMAKKGMAQIEIVCTMHFRTLHKPHTYTFFGKLE